MSTDGHTPRLEAGHAINVVSWVLLAAQNNKSPNHEFAKELVKRYYKIDPATDYNLLPEVRMERRFDAIVRLLEKIDRNVADRFRISGDTAELKKTLIEKIEKHLGENLKTLKDLQTQKQRHIEDAKRAREAANGLNAVSTIFLLLDDQQGAETFRKAADIAVAVENLSEAYAKTAVEGASMAVVNCWVALIYVVVQFFETSKKQDQMQAIQTQLIDISRQIESMRQEMHARFDRVERKLDINFHLIGVDLADTRKTLDRVETALLKIVEEIDRVRTEMRDGFSFLWRQQMISTQNKCLGYQISGKPFQLDEASAYECRDQFANIAVGAYSSPIQEGPNSTQPRDVKELSEREYSALTNFLSETDGQNFQNSVHPSNWLLGSDLFLRFFSIHPENRRIAKQSATKNKELSLDEIQRKGREIAAVIQQLAIKPSSNRFELKTAVYEDLLQRYRGQVEETLRLSHDVSKTSAGKGPNPSRDGFNQPVLVDDKYHFIAQPVPFCSPGGKVEVGPMIFWPEQLMNTAISLKYPTELYQRTETERAADIVLRPFDPQLFKLDPSFLSLIPRSVVWAARMQEQYDHVEVKPCFSKVSILNFYAKSDAFRMDIHMELDFYVTTGEAQYKSAPFLATRIVSDRHIEHPGYEMFPKAGTTPFLFNSWNGQAVPGTFSWESIRNNGPKYFKPVHIGPNPQLEAFEKNFATALSARRKVALKTLESTLSVNDVGSERLIALVTILGLDPIEPRAATFVEWLLSFEGFSSPKDLGILAMDHNLPASSVLKVVDAKIAKAKEHIQLLSTKTTLRPRTTQVEQILHRLERLR